MEAVGMEHPERDGNEENARAGAGQEQHQPEWAEMEQQQHSEEPPKPLNQSILDILDEEWRS